MPNSILAYIVIFILPFYWEARALLATRAFKEFGVAILFFLLGTIYGIELAFGWNYLPNPNILLYLLQPSAQALQTFFQVTD